MNSAECLTVVGPWIKTNIVAKKVVPEEIFSPLNSFYIKLRLDHFSCLYFWQIIIKFHELLADQLLLDTWKSDDNKNLICIFECVNLMG